MRRLNLLLALVFVARLVMAVPAKSEWRTVSQSDGTTLRVMLCGDENFHYYKTTDNIPLVRDANGDYCYVGAMGFGIVSSGILAHEPSLRSASERAGIRSLGELEAQRKYAPRHNATKARRQSRAVKTRSMADGAAKRGLVIMVSFSDQDFGSEESRSVWDDILNKEGYSENGANGSVHDYFYDQSNGLFDLKFDVAGPVRMPKSRYYYGKDRIPDDDIDMNVGELVAEACRAVADEVDFSQYDWDGDGEVEQVYILYAGWCQAVTGADSRLIWPHEYVLEAYPGYEGGITIDGVRINTYACGSEMEGLESRSEGLSGLGTFCHEFSHCLGLPDFYTYTGLDMLGAWDMLSSGCYNGDSWCPAGYTAYEKEFCGWQNAETLSSPADVTGMRPLSENGRTYKIVNECDGKDIDEYYLLENRQQSGWDKYVPGHGLLVTHVDYDQYSWYYNVVNDDYNHPRMTIIPANNRFNNYYASGFAYPYGGNKELTDTSTPAASVFNVNKDGRKYMGKPITDIAENEGVISFVFDGGSVTDGITQAESTGTERGLIGRRVSVYDASGRRVAVTDSYNGLAGYPAGIYVVRGDDGRTVKVMAE